MKTGWVIAVSDLEAKDKAYKYVAKSREETQIKADELRKRYENLFGEGRFKVEIASPHSQLNLDRRMIVKHSTATDLKILFNLLHDLNPFFFKSNDSHYYFEIDKSELVEGFVKC